MQVHIVIGFEEPLLARCKALFVLNIDNVEEDVEYCGNSKYLQLF